MAECHPVGFRWVMEAKSRGAKIIHVDPRFTRTSAVSDLHVPIRAGSDIAFLGGLIHYVIENDRWFKEYVLHYTNAPALINPDFRDTEDLDGLFSGWDEEKGQYDPSSWSYEGTEIGAAAGQRERFTGESRSERGTQSGAEHFDYTLQDPKCVFQILKRHFSRYTPEMVEEICGVPRHLFLEVAEAVCDNSGRERTTSLCPPSIAPSATCSPPAWHAPG
jgi:formate dehydrogenase major subunit